MVPAIVATADPVVLIFKVNVPPRLRSGMVEPPVALTVMVNRQARPSSLMSMAPVPVRLTRVSPLAFISSVVMVTATPISVPSFSKSKVPAITRSAMVRSPFKCTKT